MVHFTMYISVALIRLYSIRRYNSMPVTVGASIGFGGAAEAFVLMSRAANQPGVGLGVQFGSQEGQPGCCCYSPALMMRVRAAGFHLTRSRIRVRYVSWIVEE